MSWYSQQGIYHSTFPTKQGHFKISCRSYCCFIKFIPYLCFLLTMFAFRPSFFSLLIFKKSSNVRQQLCYTTFSVAFGSQLTLCNNSVYPEDSAKFPQVGNHQFRLFKICDFQIIKMLLELTWLNTSIPLQDLFQLSLNSQPFLNYNPYATEFV